MRSAARLARRDLVAARGRVAAQCLGRLPGGFGTGQSAANNVESGCHAGHLAVVTQIGKGSVELRQIQIFSNARDGDAAAGWLQFGIGALRGFGGDIKIGVTDNLGFA